MKDILLEAGLGKYKQSAYLAVVSLGKGTVPQIGKKSGVPSSKLYEVLKWLHENGYVSVLSEKPLVYRANNPKNVLKSGIEEEIERLQKLKKRVEELDTGLDIVERGTFNIVKGPEAYMKKVKEACLNSNKSVIGVFRSWKADHELLEIENAKKNVSRHFLGPITGETRERVRYRVERGAKVRHFVPDTTRFTVWDEKLLVISLHEAKNYYSLWIENPTLARIMTQHFSVLWKSAKKDREFS